MINCTEDINPDLEKLIEFRLEANVNTYAAYMNETDSTRWILTIFLIVMVHIHIMIRM